MSTTMTLSKTPQEIMNETKIPVAALGRDRFPIAPLDSSEVEAIKKVLYEGLSHLRRVAPEIYNAIVNPVPGANLEKLVLTFAAVAKAQFPTQKPYSFPSVPGKLGVAWLIPQAIKYSPTVPTSYSNNSWDIPITAGTKAYLLGSDTEFYVTSSATNAHSAILIFYNGLVEVGTTPSAQQFRLISQAKTDYGIYTVEPLVDIPVENGKTIYLYPTPMGALYVDYSTGVKWYFMPTRTGVATIKMIGLVFYEHNFLADTVYLT
jgi:hypothetical protein